MAKQMTEDEILSLFDEQFRDVVNYAHSKYKMDIEAGISDEKYILQTWIEENGYELSDETADWVNSTNF